MSHSKVYLWYDPEGDMLEVNWENKASTFEDTDNKHVLEQVDDDGNVLGFMLRGISRLEPLSPIEVELGTRPSTKLIGTTEAARELEVTTGRLRQLLGEGRIQGARHIGNNWVIPSPVQIKPGTRGPVGVAGERSA
jgi:hypothetical protein